MIDLGDFVQFDLKDPNDCMDLIEHFGFTNSQIKEMRSKGIGYQSIAKTMLIEDGRWGV